MRLKPFVILFACFVLIGAASLFGAPAKKQKEKLPPLTSINFIDRSGVSETIQSGERLKQYQDVDFFRPQSYQRVTRVFARNSKGEQKSIITSYHANGQIKQYIEALNQSAMGPYYEWHENGQLKLRVYVIGGLADLGPSSAQTWLFDGLADAYDDKGRLLAEISYTKGVLEDESLYYHTNGKIHKKVPFSQGKIHGTLEIYHPDGKLFQKIQYEDDKKTGPLYGYWPNGKLAAQETYKLDRLMEGKYFDKNEKEIAGVKNGKGVRAIFNENRLLSLNEINNGIVEGEIKEFDKNGSLTSSYRIKNGLKHGEEIEYYSFEEVGKEGVKHLSINWHDGKIQGVTKTWFSNGVLESQREMSENVKNGILTAWYENGNMMMLEEYEKDKLVKGKYFKKGDRTAVSEVKDGKGIATLFDPSGNFLRKINYQQGKPVE